MATPRQISKQFTLEKEAISCGRQRLQESTQRLEEKSYASASVYGTASISAALPLVIKEIDSSVSKLKKGAAGQHYQPVAQYLIDLEPLAIATIALKVIFDNVFSMKRDSDILANVLVSVGSALESECKFRWYRANYPELMKYIEDKYFHESCGTQQKVAIARALLTSPMLLLLDEPTTGLDPKSKRDVQSFINDVRHQQDTVVLLTTHDMVEAEKLCDQIAIIDNGKIICEGTVKELKLLISQPEVTLEDVFIQLTGKTLSEE